MNILQYSLIFYVNFVVWKMCIHFVMFIHAVCVGVSRGYTDYHQGRAIHMADSRID